MHFNMALTMTKLVTNQIFLKLKSDLGIELKTYLS